MAAHVTLYLAEGHPHHVGAFLLLAGTPQSGPGRAACDRFGGKPWHEAALTELQTLALGTRFHGTIRVIGPESLRGSVVALMRAAPGFGLGQARFVFETDTANLPPIPIPTGPGPVPIPYPTIGTQGARTAADSHDRFANMETSYLMGREVTHTLQQGSGRPGPAGAPVIPATSSRFTRAAP